MIIHTKENDTVYKTHGETKRMKDESLFIKGVRVSHSSAAQAHI